MNKTNPSVDGYLRKNKKWSAELAKLRAIVLDTPLIEEVKWRVPCYTDHGRNIAFLGAFKDCCTLSFVKGVLLKDPKHILELPGPDTQSARVIRFDHLDRIVKLAPVLKAYLLEAIEIEKSGQKVQMKKTADFAVPEELQAKLDENPALKKAFAALTPGRQRGYLLYFAGAKQSKTRSARVDKHTPRILEGKGMLDD
ncbi:MAG: hypothetical protein GC162_09610 [Planctomycetes bacterium]|nr:hypothetical protein [Planctomycetota bacterium]